MSITFQVESGTAVAIDEGLDLARRHYQEIAHYQDIALDPDIDAYVEADRAGLMRCYTVRDAGVLIGYLTCFVRRNMHYRGSLQAVQDIMFLAPEYRKGAIGYQMIRFAEEQLRAEGVQALYQHVKTTNNVGALLERIGYELVDQIYAKRLDR